MSTELSCWQGFLNFLCCGTCYDDPQVTQQRKPLLKDQHQRTGVSSHRPPPPVSTRDSYQRPPVDRTVGGLSIQQVEVQTGSHVTPEDRRDPVVVRRDEEERRSSSHSPKVQRRDGGSSSVVVKHEKEQRSPSLSPVLDHRGGSSSPVVVQHEEEKGGTPPIPIPVVLDRRESDEDHTPPHHDISQPVTPVRSPNSRSTTPISSPYHDTSFEHVKTVDFRTVSADHQSPHKKQQEKKKDSGGDSD